MIKSIPSDSILSITDVRKQDDSDPIWVVNTSTSKVRDQRRGQAVINIQDNSPLTIPNTFLPIAVTNSHNRQDVLKSQHFLQAVDKKLITLVTEEYALKILNSKYASEELDNLAKNNDAFKLAKSNIIDVSELDTEKNANVFTNRTNPRNQAKIDSILETAISSGNEAKAINSIRSIEPDLDDVDIQYIINKARTLKLMTVLQYLTEGS
jgi:hypothetical protein